MGCGVTKLLAAVAGVGRGLASAGAAGASSVVAAVDAGAWVCDRAVRGAVQLCAIVDGRVLFVVLVISVSLSLNLHVHPLSSGACLRLPLIM